MAELDSLIIADRRLEADLIERGGEIVEGEEEVRAELEKNIVKEVEKYAWFLTNNKFGELRETLKAHKKSIDAKLRQMDSVEEIIKHKVAKVLEERGPIKTTISGIDKQIEVGYTKRNKILEHKVPEDEGTYTMSVEPKLWKYLVGDQRLSEDIINWNHKVLLKDLPEGHPAIEAELHPRIKIVNRRK